jgi:hypothetical protein
MIHDLSAIYFEMPARDALGLQHVVGKLLATSKCVSFYWKLKDRAFKRAADEMQVVELAYGNIESVDVKSTMGLFKHRLILKIADPTPLAGVPGIDVGRATLMLTNREAKREAMKFVKLVDFRKTEADEEASRRRLSDLGSPL